MFFLLYNRVYYMDPLNNSPQKEEIKLFESLLFAIKL